MTSGCGDGSDPVDHRVGEPGVFGHPVGQPGVRAFGVRGEGCSRHVSVALDVVARHDRERWQSTLAPTVQRVCDQPEHAVWTRPLDVVAALGDGQRDDVGAWRGHQFDDAFAVVGGVAVVHDRSDDPGVAVVVGMLGDQCVQPVLCGHHIGHLAVRGQYANAADAPLLGGPRLE
jgi:hypothetical protein